MVSCHSRRIEAVPAQRPSGFTIVELLVAISVIAVLAAIILPAVQAAREASRRTQCRNNLKQLATAMLNHEATHGRFPTNGWGFRWIGDPNRGTDKRQPGGWIYNILPLIEQAPLRQIGRDEPAAVRQISLGRLSQAPLPVMKCPSRPGAQLGSANPAVVPYNAQWESMVAKSDYACSEGDYVTNTLGGPATLQEGDSGAYAWKDTRQATGICFQRSAVRPADIRDGMSQTYMLGEKLVSTVGYDTYDDLGHDQSMYSGVDWDINRWAIEPPLQDHAESSTRRFGSAHAQGCHMALCDGSVKLVSYNIDAEIHRRLGNRRDGLPAELP